MTDWEAESKLRVAGLGYMEASNLLYAVRLERVAAVSRKKTNKYVRIEEALRQAGVEPTQIEFSPGTYGSEGSGGTNE